MKQFALIGNPNSGKTTLFNSLTGSTAHVGNWPGVTVDKKEGVYKKLEEKVSIIDLPGIYSLSPYTPEEVISRNFILDEKPAAIINIVDVTNLERNLYLTTQVLEINVPMVVALNMADALLKDNKKVDVKALEEALGVPVILISALKEENIDELMKIAYQESLKPRKGKTVLKGSKLAHLIKDVEIAFNSLEIDNPLFHSIKLIEKDEIETKNHPNLCHIIEEFKANFKDDTFGDDLEAIIADERYKFISNNCSKTIKENKNSVKTTVSKSRLSLSDRIDKVLTNRWLGIPIFIAILAIIFHLVFSEDFLFLNAMGLVDVVSFEGTAYEGLFANGGISSPGVILANLFANTFDYINSLIASGLESINTSTWAIGLICDGMIAGVFSVIGFLPQILLLFLAFSILEDSGYMARVAFILDRIFRRFGISGRAFMPMIMGFGCSIPAMINTRTLSDEKERTATIRVIPFFSCGAKLPILTAIAGGIAVRFGFAYPDLITLSMYLLGMLTAFVAIIIMRNTTLKGDAVPFIMELPNYHMPSFKGLMLHLWDKVKHFVKKAFTIILVSTILVWVLSHFSFNWQYLEDADVSNSILANLSMLIQPIFTPLGFGSQLNGIGWVFVAASIAGLIAKENVVSLFAVLAAVVVGTADPGETESVAILIQNTGITAQGLIAFIAFNMLTIPCFAAVATAKGELAKGKLKWTLLFWIVTSLFVASMIYVIGTWVWTIAIYALVIATIVLGIIFYRKKMKQKEVI